MSAHNIVQPTKLLAYNLWLQENETTFHLQNNIVAHQRLEGWHFTYPMHCFPHY
jgi:hypothetical protein